MSCRRWNPLVVLGWLAGFWTASSGIAEGWGDRLSYTVFAEGDLSRLERGDVLGKRATLERGPNVMAVQTCYVVPVPIERTAAALLQWDPSRNPELGVRIHRPVRSPARLEDFADLVLSAKIAPDRVAYQRASELAEGSLVQFVSRSELNWFKQHRNNPAEAWKQILFGRVKSYQTSGLKEMPPYEGVRPPFKVQSGWQNVVSQTPEVTRRFIDLLQTSLNNPQGRQENTAQKFYWEMLDVQGETTFLLGVVHQRPGDGSVQTADLQFYVSAHFSSALLLHEMWPITWNGRPATLVWRGDYVLLPAAMTGQGIERMASENLLLQEVRRAVAAFVKSCQ
ncbi:MAG: hypothetical protein OHK005_07190 [Candidatus Methylacidiphilales bacterium]